MMNVTLNNNYLLLRPAKLKLGSLSWEHSRVSMPDAELYPTSLIKFFMPTDK